MLFKGWIYLVMSSPAPSVLLPELKAVVQLYTSLKNEIKPQDLQHKNTTKACEHLQAQIETHSPACEAAFEDIEPRIRSFANSSHRIAG